MRNARRYHLALYCAASTEPQPALYSLAWLCATTPPFQFGLQHRYALFIRKSNARTLHIRILVVQLPWL